MESHVANALLKLAEGTTGRKKVGLVRGLLPQITAAKAAGVPDKKIVETLREQGLDISLFTFKSILYRLRKDQKADGKNPAVKDSTEQALAVTAGSQAMPEVTAQKEEKAKASGDTNISEVNAALSNDRRSADFEKYVKPKQTLSDRLKLKPKGN